MISSLLLTSSSSAFPSYISGVHHLGWNLGVTGRFFNPNIEVVTFRLRGWCMLGVFLLPAFTRLGHECQELWSLYDGMRVCADQTSVYTLIRKSLRGMESEPMLTPREKSPLPENFSSEEDRTHDAASSRTASQHTTS